MNLQSITLENLLKKTADPTNKRKYNRLPVQMPVLYCFLDKKKKKKGEYMECSSIDVSNGGLALQILDPPLELKKKLSINGHRLSLRIDLPGMSDLIEFNGITRWYRGPLAHEKNKAVVGIEFDGIEIENKISILTYALKINRRKRNTKISLGVLAALLIAALALGSFLFISKQDVEQKLVVSEENRLKLKNEIIELIKKKNEMSNELQEIIVKINKQTQIIAGQNIELNKTRTILTEKETRLKKINKEWEEQNVNLALLNNKLEKSQDLAVKLEEKIFLYVVIAEKELIQIGDPKKVDLNIFTDADFKKAETAMDKLNYNMAIRLYKQAIARFPNSPWGYSGLARAYYRLKKEKQSREIFKKYLEQMNRLNI